jgi:hypothetical protein
MASENTFGLTVGKRPTTTTITCIPTIVPITTGTVTCTAVVSDAGPASSATAPTGFVTFSRDGVLSIPPTQCTLTTGPGSTSSCSVTLTSGTAKVEVIGATYSGSNVHASSSATTPAIIVFYDPNGGFVTGGGYVTHNPAWTVPQYLTPGKDNFGFVAKYKKNAPAPAAPEGETEFQCKVCDINFHSSSLDWLIVSSITSGPNAGAMKGWYQGSGTINGSGDYGFQVTIIDKGSIDYFRIKIWNKTSGGVIYDNQPGAPDGTDPITLSAGGNIVIHK